MMDFKCPKCGEEVSVPDSVCGQTETCPHCGNVTIVPEREPVMVEQVGIGSGTPTPPDGPRPSQISSGDSRPPAESTDRKWHCQMRGQRFGPVEEAVMKQWVRDGRVATTDQVWTEGMAAWAPLSTVEGMLGTVPPLPAPQQPVLITPRRQCIRCGHQGHMLKQWDSWVLPVAIVVAFFTMGLGLLLLLVPKKYQCPHCGASFE